MTDDTGEQPLVHVAFPAGDPPRDGVALVTLDRPDALNALSFGLLEELDEILAVLDDDESCRAIVITGAGSRAFAAGVDIRDLAGSTRATTLNAFNYLNPTTVLLTDGDRTMFGAQLGTMIADANGVIEVFIDDRGNGPNERTLYDGVTLADGTTTPFGQTFTINGNLALSSGSTALFDIAKTGVNDRLAITGTLSVTNGFILQVVLNNTVSASSLVAGNTWNLFDFASASGTFNQANFILPTGLTAGLAWDTSSLLTTGELKVVAAGSGALATNVPEPTSIGLLALAVIGCGLRLRREKLVVE